MCVWRGSQRTNLVTLLRTHPLLGLTKGKAKESTRKTKLSVSTLIDNKQVVQFAMPTNYLIFPLERSERQKERECEREAGGERGKRARREWKGWIVGGGGGGRETWERRKASGRVRKTVSERDQRERGRNTVGA